MEFNQFLDSQGFDEDMKRDLCVIHAQMNYDITDKKTKKRLMDSLWDSLYLNGVGSVSERLSLFYQDLIWLYQGISTCLDSELFDSRNNVALFVKKLRSNQRILDYGGGFGTLSLLLENACSDSYIDLYDPYSHAFVDRRLLKSSRISLQTKLGNVPYDLVICSDVLEHSFNPLLNLREITRTLELNGFLIIQNCFYPAIKCHLPSTFYLRYFFRLFASLLGLHYIGRVPRSPGFIIFHKRSNQIMKSHKLVYLEKIAQLLYSYMNVLGFNQINRFFNKFEVSAQNLTNNWFLKNYLR